MAHTHIWVFMAHSVICNTHDSSSSSGSTFCPWHWSQRVYAHPRSSGPGWGYSIQHVWVGSQGEHVLFQLVSSLPYDFSPALCFISWVKMQSRDWLSSGLVLARVLSRGFFLCPSYRLPPEGVALIKSDSFHHKRSRFRVGIPISNDLRKILHRCT